MNIFSERVLRLCLKPVVKCGLPGRLRLSFSKFDLLPDAAVPYLGYVGDVLKMLNGVKSVEVNRKIGTILILYDAAEVSQTTILKWVDIVVDTGIDMVKQLPLSDLDDRERLYDMLHKRLILRLPEKGGSND